MNSVRDDGDSDDGGRPHIKYRLERVVLGVGYGFAWSGWCAHGPRRGSARLWVVYALVDGSPVMEEVHLRAARAVWDYCQASVEWIFGSATGDEAADMILRALLEVGPEGMTGTDIRSLFANHLSGSRRLAAVGLLVKRGLAVTVVEPTPGAPIRRTYAIDHAPQ